MWQHTEITRRLGIALPIIQGPFGGGLSSVELVAAVSNAGGLGSFGVHHLTGEQIAHTAAAIRKKTQRPFALNLWLPHHGSDNAQISDEDYTRNAVIHQNLYAQLGISTPPKPTRFAPAFQEQFEAVLAARPAVFSFVFGVPDAQVIASCQAAGIITLGTATSVDEAVQLDRAGVDLIVATGFEAGGHRVSFLTPPEHSLNGTLALIPQVVDAVHAPVIAAGGIVDGRGLAAALALGAEAAQIGTAFLACRESGTSDMHRAALFSSQAKRTTLSRVASGRLARFIHNRFIDELQPHAHALPDYPVQSWFTAPIKQAALQHNRPDLAPLYAGQGAGLLRQQTASELIATLVEDTAGVFGRF